MRINEVGSLPITPVDPRPEVEAPRPVRTVDPVTPETRQDSDRRPPLPLPEEPPPASVPPTVNRRMGDRRIEERRKQQIPVLIDTRVADRRVARRRQDDPPPPSLKIEA